MTKKEELAILRETAAKLGSDSYTGTWLADQLPYIESAMLSDVLVSHRALTVSEIHNLHSETVAKAREDAARIVGDAEKNAERIVSKARQEAKQHLLYLAKAIEETKVKINSITY